MIRVNLLPLKSRLLAEARLKVGLAFIVSMALGLFAVGLHGFLGAKETKTQTARLGAIQSELTQLEPQVKAIRKAKKLLEQDQRRLLVLKALDDRRLSLPHFLVVFAKDLFPQGWIESMRLKEDTLEVQLFSSSRVALSSLEKTIQGYPSVVMARVSNPQGIQVEGKTFFKASLSVKLGIKGGLGGD
jgi:Tfp pilus assembly protein PilN